MLRLIFNDVAVNTIHRAMIFETFYFTGLELNIIKILERYDSIHKYRAVINCYMINQIHGVSHFLYINKILNFYIHEIFSFPSP